MACFSASVLLRPFNAPLIFWRTTGDRYRDLRLYSLLIFFLSFPINTWIVGKEREKPTVFWVGLVGLLSEPSILGRQFTRWTVLRGFEASPQVDIVGLLTESIPPQGGRKGGRSRPTAFTDSPKSRCVGGMEIHIKHPAFREVQHP